MKINIGKYHLEIGPGTIFLIITSIFVFLAIGGILGITAVVVSIIGFMTVVSKDN